MDTACSETTLHALAWALTDGVGPITFGRLLSEFGSPEAALGAPAGRLAKIRGISSERAEAIARGREAALAAAQAELAVCGENNVRVISRFDADFPPGLRQIPDAPIVLYVRGELLPSDAVAIAVVGSRRCSIYGSEQARRFGELLAGAGFTVVSGLARGVDAFAHHGAIDAGGRCVAVVGCGLDHIYPAENLALAERILTRGAWISELPIRTAVRAENFPSRNRIIAGMSLGTLVVEAAHRSGALITARLASEYNREVFAVPGRVDEPMSHGTNGLIRDGGAKLVTCLDDILDELSELRDALVSEAGSAEQAAAAGAIWPPEERGASPPTLFEGTSDGGEETDAGKAGRKRRARGREKASADVGALPLPPLSGAEQAVYDAIPAHAVHQETVLAGVGVPVGDALAAFTGLELKGLIRRLPGQMFARR